MPAFSRSFLLSSSVAFHSASLSLIVDGMPSPILLFYLAVELTVGTLGLPVLNRERPEGRVP